MAASYRYNGMVVSWAHDRSCWYWDHRQEFVPGAISRGTKYQVIWPGRAAILSLRGISGSLDIVVSYFHTWGQVQELDKFGVHPSMIQYCNTFPKLREHLRNRISAAIRPKEHVLTLLGADFNWVPQDVDMRSRSSMGTTGGRNNPEERHFQSVVCQRHGFVELHQSDMTHSGSSSLSRLDRFYINQHLSEQIDWELQSVALEWRLDLSNHRAIMVARRLPTVLDAATRPIPPGIDSHPDFARRVQLAYDVKVEECFGPSKLKRLALLKEAIRDVATNLAKTGEGLKIACDTADKLGVVMRFLRAAEKGALGTISHCLIRYPHITSLVNNPYNISGSLAVSLRALKDHAVELAREFALEQLRNAQGEEEELGVWRR